MGNQKIMVVFNKAPYERISVVESIRAATGVIAMDIEGITVFIDDGVYALLKNQNPAGTGLESVEKGLKLLDMNDAQIKVVRESLVERGIEESDLLELAGLEVISAEELGELMLDYNSVFVI